MSRGTVDTVTRLLRGAIASRDVVISGGEKRLEINSLENGIPMTLILEPDIDDRGMFLAARIVGGQPDADRLVPRTPGMEEE